MALRPLVTPPLPPPGAPPDDAPSGRFSHMSSDFAPTLTQQSELTALPFHESGNLSRHTSTFHESGNLSRHTSTHTSGFSRHTSGPFGNKPMHLQDLPGIFESDLKDAFNEIDFDQNGFIGASELRYMLMLIGENPSDKEINEMLHMVDCGDGKAFRVGDTVRVTSDRETLKNSVVVLGDVWDESMCKRLDTLQTVIEVTVDAKLGTILGLQPVDVEDSWRYEWFCSAKVVKKEASYADFLRLMDKDSPVPKEMALIVNESRDKHEKKVQEEEQAKAEQSSRLSKSQKQTVKEVDLVLKVASGFLYMGKSPTLERGQHLPQTRDAEDGRARARPTKMAPPLALSPRAMRNARKLADQGAFDKGKGKGKGKDGKGDGLLPRGVAMS